MTLASQWLFPAYLANIVILVPVVWAMTFGTGTSSVFQGMVEDSDGLRLLVASLWFAILVGSIAGIVWPGFFAPLLLVQIIYKSTWLILFILPLWRAGMPYPGGITMVFLIIALSYPVLFWMALRG